MPLIDLHHVAIKARDLDATVRFYTELLGMRRAKRPAFDFPGAWLKMGKTMFHFYGGAVARDGRGRALEGSGAVDHIALAARGFERMRKRIAESGIEWREAIVPGGAIWQLFVWDPNGVKIEINFERAKEPKKSRGPVAKDEYRHAHDHHHHHAHHHGPGREEKTRRRNPRAGRGSASKVGAAKRA